MNTQLVHIVILMLLLSLTAHEVHASIAHDIEACDVCIHVQSNDDALPNDGPHYVLLDLAFHLKAKAPQDSLKSTFQLTADYIRGPPVSHGIFKQYI